MKTTLLFLILAVLAVSGCIEEKETLSIPQPSLPDITQPVVPGEFEIRITSYYFVYFRNNHVLWENTTILGPELVEKIYVIPRLSIKNNDSFTRNFSINDLELQSRGQVFTPADTGTVLSPQDWVYVLSDIEQQDRLNETEVHPGEVLGGIVIFPVDACPELPFSLRYNTTPVPSPSIEKSLAALTAAEQFDYSQAFEIPSLDGDRMTDAYYPEPVYPFVWATWVNRSVFDYYLEQDKIAVRDAQPGYMPGIEIAYAVKVIPEQDLTVYSVDHSIVYEEKLNGRYRIRGEGTYRGHNLYVVDEKEQELFTRSIDPRVLDTRLTILDNQTYRRYSGNIPQTGIRRATIVHVSFYSTYGWGPYRRLSFTNQDIIVDEGHNIVLARYDRIKAVS